MDQAVRPLPPKTLSILVGLILKLWSCSRVAEWLRRRVGTRKVPGSGPVVGTA